MRNYLMTTNITRLMMVEILFPTFKNHSVGLLNRIITLLPWAWAEVLSKKQFQLSERWRRTLTKTTDSKMRNRSIKMKFAGWMNSLKTLAFSKFVATRLWRNSTNSSARKFFSGVLLLMRTQTTLWMPRQALGLFWDSRMIRQVQTKFTSNSIARCIN